MIPSRRLIVLSAILVIPLLLAGISRSTAEVALLLNLVLVAVACVDLLVSPAPSVLDVERSLPEVLSVGASNPVTLQIRNRSIHRLNVTAHDDPGEQCTIEGLPQSVWIEAGKAGLLHYTIRPGQRGMARFEAVHIMYPSRFRLWLRRDVRPLRADVPVYPDIRAVHRYELLARQNRLAEIGLRSVRMPGQGREFERLREYRCGDELRQIDWKATARQQTLISREFTVERNQNIVIMLDCGRFMRNQHAGISCLDVALNSAILLSYIALGQGDNVSLLAFSSRVERYVRPVRGKAGIQAILHSTYDIAVSDHVSDYSMALEFLTRVQRKRALVVLMTFVTDERQLRVIGSALKLRSLPYLPLCVLLQDESLQNMADRIPATDLEAFEAAAAAGILTGHYQEVAAMRDAGILLIDSSPRFLTERLLNEYLRIKARNLI